MSDALSWLLSTGSWLCVGILGLGLAAAQLNHGVAVISWLASLP